MTVDEVVSWYEKNVNYKLTRAFLQFLLRLGIIDVDIDLEMLNLYLLQSNSNGFLHDNNGHYEMKENVIDVVKRYADNETEKVKKVLKDNNRQPRKFKIEKMNGNRLKLVKT